MNILGLHHLAYLLELLVVFLKPCTLACLLMFILFCSW
uniref:Uncharacterized protein n=1 Tax=Arundo donax TaxID=35708 RepID=A0A0A9GPF1_ARUDO